MDNIARFKQLPTDTQRRILDEHRDWNAHDNWYDDVYQNFSERMDGIGIYVEEMRFTGFWSQGDGACFEGKVCNWPKFLESMGCEDAVLIGHAAAAWSFMCRHTGHYCHENSVSFTCDLPLPDPEEYRDTFAEFYCPYNDELRTAVWLTALDKYDENKISIEFEDKFKSHMRALYKELEAEYEHLTSDEVVLESLEANDRLEEIINEELETQ
jgi:hypothetical protein